MQNNREIGARYEQIAGKYLQERGLKILEYNFHCSKGEIDIVAKDKETLVFVEVKYRRTLGSGSPLEAVNRKKQMVISKCAKYYMMYHCRYEMACRFDVIGILGEDSNYKITHIENAFDYCG